MKKEPFVYETETAWGGDLRGELRAADLPMLAVAAPPEFHGEEGVWSPEHLYVGAVNACFMMTFLVLARNSGLALRSFRSAAKGTLQRVEGAGFQVAEIVLSPTIVIQSASDLDRAMRLVTKAEKSCILSNSIKTSVAVAPRIYCGASPSVPCPPMPELARPGN